ncbi:MAG: cadmium-translocating P-type ATPase [Oscillospiraceae bacterium]|jgi:cadmium-exporting ATPase|nr:MAG: cadmium-translocating P-type ATPase [Oscillospiraceae bacterium]
MNKKQKKVLIRIIITAVLLVALKLLIEFSVLPETGIPTLCMYLIPYVVIGYDIIKKAFKGIIHGRPFDENFLMTVATIGAIATGEYSESAAVMLFYQIGELFQSYAVGKSRKSISTLMDIRPDYAWIDGENGEQVQVDPSTVEVGTVITVRPGERVPIDGVIVGGASTVDTVALTGESVPSRVGEGDNVLSGCINLSGALKIKTEKQFSESTASKILELAADAGAKKSRSEAFISRFARIYTPCICIGALALAVLPPVIRLLMGMSGDWSSWIYRALTFLVISCPCALVISIPLTFFAGIGSAGKSGILVKGSGYMEMLSRVRTVAFDKTGTMTKGVFEVAGVHHSPLSSGQLIEYAALAEGYSGHPISRSLQKAYGKKVDNSRISDVTEHGGKGITALVDGARVAVGNDKLMRELGIEYLECHHTGTVVHVALEGEYAGHILIKDVIKPDAKEAIADLHALGITDTVMLSGDRDETAKKVGAELGIDRTIGSLMPADKVGVVENMLGKNGAVAFVGDGINDAPVLARADVGIAMGALGSDAAIEAADVVIMNDSPRGIARAIRISRKCMRIVYENITFAIAVKLICLVLGATGHADMWLAVFADVGVMVIAVLNAIRALHDGWHAENHAAAASDTAAPDIGTEARHV